MRVTLSFQQIECLRCHDRRTRGVPCPTCGLDPDEREVDPKRQQRQKSARAALQLLDSSDPRTTDPLVLGPGMWGSLNDIVDDYSEALPRITAGDDEPLRVVIEKLLDLKAAAALGERFRPWLKLWAAFDKSLEEIEVVVRLHLAAIAANTPLEAQRFAEQAQRALDAAADALQSFNEETEREEAIADAATPGQATAVLLAQAFESSGATDVMDFDAGGAERYRWVTSSESVLPGAGLVLQMSALQVAALVDVDRLWDVARETFIRLKRDLTRLRSAVSDPQWLEDLQEATLAVHDAGQTYGTALISAKHPRQAVRGLLDFAHILVERPAKTHLALLLMGALRKDYSTLRARDAGQLLNTAAQHKLSSLLNGVDGTLRVAKAHESFRVEGESVELLNKRGEVIDELTIDALVDRTLLGLESVIGIQIGVVCAAIETGADLTDIYPLSIADALGLDWMDTIPMVLSMSGWTNIELERDDRLRIKGRVAVGVKKPFPMVMTLAEHLPEDLEGLRLEWLDSADEIHVLEGPTGPMFEYLRAEGALQRECCSLKVQSSFTLDGTPGVRGREVRKYCAMKVAQRLSGSISEVITTVSQLRDLALALDDQLLIRGLDAVVSMKRTEVLQVPPPTAVHDAFKAISAWEQLSVDQIPDR